MCLSHWAASQQPLRALVFFFWAVAFLQLTGESGCGMKHLLNNDDGTKSVRAEQMRRTV